MKEKVQEAPKVNRRRYQKPKLATPLSENKSMPPCGAGGCPRWYNR